MVCISIVAFLLPSDILSLTVYSGSVHIYGLHIYCSHKQNEDSLDAHTHSHTHTHTLTHSTVPYLRIRTPLPSSLLCLQAQQTYRLPHSPFYPVRMIDIHDLEKAKVSMSSCIFVRQYRDLYVKCTLHEYSVQYH